MAAFEGLTAPNLVLNSRGRFKETCMAEFQCSELTEVEEGQEINCRSGLLDSKAQLFAFQESQFRLLVTGSKHKSKIL